MLFTRRRSQRGLSNGGCIGKFFVFAMSVNFKPLLGVIAFLRVFVFLCNFQEALRSVSDTDQAKNALSLMQVYVNNIVKDPVNPKYRKIRISKLMNECLASITIQNWECLLRKRLVSCNMNIATSNIICMRPFCTSMHQTAV